MTASTASLAYRRAALQQASTIGLVIALYDTLAGNLTRAAAALEKNDIETRTRELVHGFKVLQQLDAMLDMERGGTAAVNLRRFYTHLRGQMLAAQFRLSPAILYDQIRIVMEVRGAWQQLDSQGAQPGSARVAAAAPTTGWSGSEAQAGVSFSCSG